MTEKRWLRGKLWGNLPGAMLEVVRGASERKLRLVLCALMQRSGYFGSDGVRAATELAERWADGTATGREVVEFNQPGSRGPDWGNWTVLAEPVTEALELCARSSHSLDMPDVLRDIFGNPFRPVSLNPEWRTSTVVALATGIYAERAFDRMPILADALQDAGCDNDDILSHCRDTSLTHVRGCWVVDLVLGKE
jgi:hypothetical protein